MARIIPIAYGEKLFSVPKSGKNTTKTSATDETAKETYIAAMIPGFFTSAIAALYVPTSLTFAATDGLSLRHLMTGASEITQITAPSKNALEVDLGRVPSEPATKAASNGPVKCPRDALNV